MSKRRLLFGDPPALPEASALQLCTRPAATTAMMMELLNAALDGDDAFWVQVLVQGVTLEGGIYGDPPPEWGVLKMNVDGQATFIDISQIAALAIINLET